MCEQLSLKFPEPDTKTTVIYQGYRYDDGSFNNCYDGGWTGWLKVDPAATLEQAEELLKPYVEVYKDATKIEMVVTTIYKKMIREDIVIEKD